MPPSPVLCVAWIYLCVCGYMYRTTYRNGICRITRLAFHFDPALTVQYLTSEFPEHCGTWPMLFLAIFHMANVLASIVSLGRCSFDGPCLLIYYLDCAGVRARFMHRQDMRPPCMFR
jgi:hypothetical protein